MKMGKAENQERLPAAADDSLAALGRDSALGRGRLSCYLAGVEILEAVG